MYNALAVMGVVALIGTVYVPLDARNTDFLALLALTGAGVALMAYRRRVSRFDGLLLAVPRVRSPGPPCSLSALARVRPSPSRRTVYSSSIGSNVCSTVGNVPSFTSAAYSETASETTESRSAYRFESL